MTDIPEACKNTDKVLWLDDPGDPGYSPRLFVTERGGIGIAVGGTVYVRPIRHWHALVNHPDYFVARGCVMREEIEVLRKRLLLIRNTLKLHLESQATILIHDAIKATELDATPESQGGHVAR